MELPASFCSSHKTNMHFFFSISVYDRKQIFPSISNTDFGTGLTIKETNWRLYTLCMEIMQRKDNKKKKKKKENRSNSFQVCETDASI